jgi:hypothetical protein
MPMRRYFVISSLFVACFLCSCAPGGVSTPNQENFGQGSESCEELRLSLENQLCQSCHGPGRDNRAPDGEFIGNISATIPWLFSASHAGSILLRDVGINETQWQQWEEECPQQIKSGNAP